MIAPLGKFGLRGVAWYQGEANAGLDDAQHYQAQLQMLFTDWRRQFEFAAAVLRGAARELEPARDRAGR